MVNAMWALSQIDKFSPPTSRSGIFNSNILRVFPSQNLVKLTKQGMSKHAGGTFAKTLPLRQPCPDQPHSCEDSAEQHCLCILLQPSLQGMATVQRGLHTLRLRRFFLQETSVCEWDTPTVSRFGTLSLRQLQPHCPSLLWGLLFSFLALCPLLLCVQPLPSAKHPCCAPSLELNLSLEHKLHHDCMLLAWVLWQKLSQILLSLRNLWSLKTAKHPDTIAFINGLLMLCFHSLRLLVSCGHKNVICDRGPWHTSCVSSSGRSWLKPGNAFMSPVIFCKACLLFLRQLLIHHGFQFACFCTNRPAQRPGRWDAHSHLATLTSPTPAGVLLFVQLLLWEGHQGLQCMANSLSWGHSNDPWPNTAKT